MTDTASPVRYQRDGKIARIIIDKPPVNALGVAVRRGIQAGLRQALADDAVKAIVLSAEGRTFPAGADISEFGNASQELGLPDLCDEIEASQKPIMAAMHGTALGGGLELAMACHYRVAHEKTRLGLPEVTLGILPGAGGTQRTPRLIGAEGALELMLSGLPISAQEALELGLIDAIAQDSLDDVITLMAEETPKLRPTREIRKHLNMGTEYMAQVRLWRDEVRGSLAREKIVDCVEAALLLPFDAGLELERDAFDDCLASPVSNALRHAFFAERKATKFPELVSYKPRPVEAVAVVGGGLMGAGVATACLGAGLPVTLIERDEPAASLALERIGTFFQREAKAGRITQERGSRALEHLRLSIEPRSVSGADVVIECLPEEARLKEEVLRGFAGDLKDSAVLVSNTSYLDVEALSRAVGRQANTLAMHFFAPVARMKLVEVGVTKDCAPDAVSTVVALARRLNKMPVRCKARPGLIGNTVLTAYREACDRLVLHGAAPQEIDAAMRQNGMPIGPYEVLDRSGLDISHARRKGSEAAVALGLLDEMCAAGMLGRKTGRGYYLYADGAAAGTPNPEMLKMLDAERAARGISPRPVSAREAWVQVLLSMANCGAGLVEAGVAHRPSDIDAVMLHGFGYPRTRGGPMHEADAVGLFEVARRFDRYAEADPDGWKISPLLRRLALERLRFASLNETP